MIQDGTCLADVFTAAAPSPSASLVTAGVLADNKTRREPGGRIPD